jgi:hypothetical protein
MDGPIAIKERLTLMASTGATLRELVAALDRYRNLARNDYDSLWLHCWVLDRRQPSPLARPSEATEYDEVGYGEIGPG